MIPLRSWLASLLLACAACTGAPRFGPPLTVAQAGALNPSLAIDPRSGATYVTWIQRDSDSTAAVMLARLDRGASAFGAPVRVSTEPAQPMVATQNPPQVVAGPDGVVLVGWVSNRAPDSAAEVDLSIRLARSLDGGASFAPPLSLVGDSTVPAQANLYFDLASAADGSVYVSWLDLHFYTDTLAERARHHVGESVPAPESRVDLRVARSRDGGQHFTNLGILDSTSCICCRTAVAAGPDGEVHTMWRHVFPGDVRDFLSARSADGGRRFQLPVRVHEDHWVLNGCPDIGPDLAVDSRNGVHAAWYTGAPGRTGLWYAHSPDGGGHFDQPIPILVDHYVPPSQVRLVMAQGRPWAVWEDLRQPTSEVRIQSPGRGSLLTLGRGAFPGAAAGAGLLAVSWLDGGAVRVRVADAGS